MIYCPNCGKRSGFKRALGFGTYFMVLITFGLWLFAIPFYPTRCINCGLTSGAAFWESLSIGARRFLAASAVIAVVLWLVWVNSAHPGQPAGKSEDTQPAVAALSPHEQHLADLRKKKEGLSWQIAIEREQVKHLAQEGMKLSMDRFADPDEREYLMKKMDEEGQRAERLIAEGKALDAEIATEEGQSPGQPELASDSQPTEATEDTSPDPATDIPQSTPAAVTTLAAADPVQQPESPTSGVLCNGTVSVPQNYELIFNDLPADRLRLTFDRYAWQATMRRQSDGRQTLVMRSTKPGIQNRCEIRWEIDR